jgi:hypothetical protein
MHFELFVPENVSDFEGLRRTATLARGAVSAQLRAELGDLFSLPASGRVAL